MLLVGKGAYGLDKIVSKLNCLYSSSGGVGVSGFAKILVPKLRSVPLVGEAPTFAESCENKFCQLEAGKTYLLRILGWWGLRVR